MTQKKVNTAPGIPSEYFSGRLLDEHEGEGQGIANSGKNWNLIRSTMMKTAGKRNSSKDIPSGTGYPLKETKICLKTKMINMYA